LATVEFQLRPAVEIYPLYRRPRLPRKPVTRRCPTCDGRRVRRDTDFCPTFGDRKRWGGALNLPDGMGCTAPPFLGQKFRLLKCAFP
jgi:hypothetical protein